MEAGGLPVSRASRLTALPENEQAQAVAEGAGERAEPALTGSFGVVCLGARERDAFPAIAGKDGVVFL